jgi:hypothetical protein
LHRHALLAAALAVPLFLPCGAGTTKDDAKAAALRFGAALTGAHASGLRELLPRHGTVRLTLAKLTSEEGSFGAGQVEAVFRDGLAQVRVHSFDVVRLESDEKSFALVHVRVALTDRQGRACRVALHLSFQPEDGAWVIREIKEILE